MQLETLKDITYGFEPERGGLAFKPFVLKIDKEMRIFIFLLCFNCFVKPGRAKKKRNKKTLINADSMFFYGLI